MPRGRRGLGGRGGRGAGRVGASVGGAGRGGQVRPFPAAQEAAAVEAASPAELPSVAVVLGRPLPGLRAGVGGSVRVRPAVRLSGASRVGSGRRALGGTVPRRPLHLGLDGPGGGGAVLGHGALQAAAQVERLEVAVAVEALGAARPGQQRALAVRPQRAVRGRLVDRLVVLQLQAGRGETESEPPRCLRARLRIKHSIYTYGNM